MKELIGKKIHKIWINEDQHVLIFDTTSGDIAYEAYGECCSETWFADIIGVRNLLGATVATAEDVEVASIVDDRSRQEVDIFYGKKITTEKGHADIVYRNSSNGYYGGACSYTPGFERPANLKEITGDWSA